MIISAVLVRLSGPLDRLVYDFRQAFFDSWYNAFLGSGLIPRDLRFSLYRLSGLKIDGRANIYPGVRFKSVNISFGHGVMVNEGVYFDNVENIAIGNSVAIGPQALFVTSSHLPGASDSRAGRVVASPITVEDGCWLGARTIVLPGVTVRRGCVIAAGAVVTKDTRPDGLYGGVPAVRIRDLGGADLGDLQIDDLDAPKAIPEQPVKSI